MSFFTYVIIFIQALLTPYSLFFAGSAAAIGLYFFGKKIAARTVFAISFVILVVFSYPVGQNFLAAPLEKTVIIHNPSDYPNVSTVVVLGGGRHPESDRPTTAKMTTSTTMRLVEGIRIFNQIDGLNLIVTGEDRHYGSIAALMKQCAVDLGVEEHKIITVENAKNTREEARFTAHYVRDDTVFLVSSAAHLKRAAKNFEREGVYVIPMPAEYQTHPGEKYFFWGIFPHPRRLENSAAFIREHKGLLWEIFRR